MLGKLYAHQVVRTDSKEQKLDMFFTPRNKSSSSVVSEAATAVDCTASVVKDVESMDFQSSVDISVPTVEILSSSNSAQCRATTSKTLSSDSAQCRATTLKTFTVLSESSTSRPESSESTSSRRDIKLTSVLQLKQNIESKMNEGLYFYYYFS